MLTSVEPNKGKLFLIMHFLWILCCAFICHPMWKSYLRHHQILICDDESTWRRPESWLDLRSLVGPYCSSGYCYTVSVEAENTDMEFCWQSAQLLLISCGTLLWNVPTGTRVRTIKSTSRLISGQTLTQSQVIFILTGPCACHLERKTTCDAVTPCHFLYVFT